MSISVYLMFKKNSVIWNLKSAFCYLKNLLLNLPRFFIKSIGKMTTAAFAAIPSFFMVFFLLPRSLVFSILPLGQLDLDLLQPRQRMRKFKVGVACLDTRKCRPMREPSMVVQLLWLAVIVCVRYEIQTLRSPSPVFHLQNHRALHHLHTWQLGASQVHSASFPWVHLCFSRPLRGQLYTPADMDDQGFPCGLDCASCRVSSACALRLQSAAAVLPGFDEWRSFLVSTLLFRAVLQTLRSRSRMVLEREDVSRPVAANVRVHR